MFELKLNDSQKRQILAASRVAAMVIDDESTPVFHGNEVPTAYSSYYTHHRVSRGNFSVCYCKHAYGKKFHGAFCPYCGSVANIILASKDYVKKVKDETEKLCEQANTDDTIKISYISTAIDSKHDFSGCWFVAAHPDEKAGIIIALINPSIKYSDSFDVNSFEFKIKTLIEVIPNKGVFAYKCLKKGNVPIDIMEALNLNSKTLQTEKNFLWDDANSVLDFLDKNPMFASYSGLKACYNQTYKSIDRNSFFQFYIAAYAMYPSIEKIAKTGMAYFIADLIWACANKCNKDAVRNALLDLQEIINPEATSAKDVINLPSYVVDILKETRADVSTIQNWVSIFSYDNMSKDNFIKLLESEEYAHFLDNCARLWNFRIVEILKYGYTMAEVLKYIISQKDYKEFGYSSSFHMFKDYLLMCDVMGIKPERFPSQLKASHDSVYVLYESKKQEVANSRLKEIADEFRKVCPPNNEDFSIIIPESVKDFVQEGIDQHNCVGSYVKRVAEKKCLIFFIRETSNIDKSFITAEITPYGDGVGQVMYKNNITCSNPKILDFIRSFSNKAKKLLK